MSVDTSKTTIRTSLKRVRGLGSAHHGTSDFFRQRLTAIGAIPTPMKADEFKAFISSEIKIWREILATVGIEPL